MGTDFTERQDQYTKATGFQVQITGSASEGTTDGSWKVVRGGGIRFHEGTGPTTGRDKFIQHTLVTKEWDDITLIGPVTVSRKDMLNWYKATVDGKDHRRNISIILLGPNSKATHQYNYNDCFLTSYKLTPLDSESEQECEEEVTICVGYSDNYLK